MSRLSPRRLTLGRIARLFGLARASLLNYEALGLLLPAGRSAAGYRWYSEAEIERLQTIRQYREAGLSLPTICDLLVKQTAEGGKANEPAMLLEKRLTSLSQEVERLKQQQQMLARLLAAPEFRSAHACQGVDAWVALLERVGFSQADRLDWHRKFEAESAQEHADFLRALGLSEAEVLSIRQASSANPEGADGSGN